jgi:single-stranded DNA-binding protein
VDLNLVVVCGRLVAEPEVRQFPSGSTMVRLLVTTRIDEPTRRIDVLPVTIWDPDERLLSDLPRPGDRIWSSGAVQRRFWDGEAGRRSRLEIVASHALRVISREDAVGVEA